MSMVTWCSWRSLVEARSDAARRWSSVGSPLRGAVPAIGWERTTSPARDTSSSGLAPDEAVDRHERGSRGTGAAGGARIASVSNGRSAVDVELAGQHDLAQLGAVDQHLGGVARRGRTTRRVERRADRDAAGRGRVDSRRDRRRPARRPTAVAAAAAPGRAGVGLGRVGVAHRGDPAGAVLGPADDQLGHQQLAPAPGRTAGRRTATGPEPGRPTSSSASIAASAAATAPAPPAARVAGAASRPAAPRPGRPAPTPACARTATPSAPADGQQVDVGVEARGCGRRARSRHAARVRGEQLGDAGREQRGARRRRTRRASSIASIASGAGR